MAQRLVRLTINNNDLLSAVDKLSKARKLSTILVMALQHFLETEEGRYVLESFAARPSKAPEPAPAPEPKSEPDTHGQTPSKVNLDSLFGG